MLAGALTRFPWPVVISGREGRSYAIGGRREHWCGQPLAIRFNTDEALNAVLSLDGMRVLEGFVRGDIEMNGNLYALGYLGDYLDIGMSKARLLAFLGSPEREIRGSCRSTEVPLVVPGAS